MGYCFILFGIYLFHNIHSTFVSTVSVH